MKGAFPPQPCKHGAADEAVILGLTRGSCEVLLILISLMYNLETYHQNGKKGKKLLNNSERYSALESRVAAARLRSPSLAGAHPTLRVTEFRWILEQRALAGKESPLPEVGGGSSGALGLCWAPQGCLQSQSGLCTGSARQAGCSSGCPGQVGGGSEWAP